MKYRRYSGSFVSIGGTVWRADIMQEASEAFGQGSLVFPADSPLTIEWQRQDKETVMQGSTATLKVISPGDRTYQELYTIEVGAIRLDVYKDSVLYWSGALDAEFYEEPYERLDGYEVSLTFSDFGILDRMKYDLSGMRTLKEIITYSLQRAGINYTSLDTSMITTTFTDGTSITGGGLSVRSDNFTDEDGEQSTLKEAVEGILQPLAIRMIQRGGVVYLYDLNGLYSGEQSAIYWTGSTQTMSTDKVANNVSVTFSPYSNSKLMEEDGLEYGGKYDVEHVNLTSNAPTAADEYGEYYSYYPDYSDDTRQGSNWDYNLVDFTIFTHTDGKGIASKGNGCKFFHILPMTGSATECTGIMGGFYTGGHGDLSTGWPKRKGGGFVHSGTKGSSEIFTTHRVFVPKLSDTDAAKYRIRLKEEILLDARYNPFGGSTEGNEEDNDGTVKACSAFVFIPVTVTLYDADGTALYHYSNKTVAQGAAKGHLGYTKGEWIAGADPGGDCWLEYYDPDDLKGNAGIRGWQCNRHAIGRPDGRGGRMETVIFKSFAEMERGEYMVYPPCAGYIEVQVQVGMLGYDYGQKADDCEFGSTQSQWNKKDIYGKLRWCLYKSPDLEIVNNNLIFDEAELEDVEYSGYINKAAKEGVSIDTICGTAAKVCPTARGAYHGTSTGEQISVLTRAGITDHPERLLIGTLYSQYAGRKTTLAGEARPDGGLYCYTESNQDGKRLMLMSDVQDLRMDSTEAEYCEFSADEYTAIEEVE